MKEYTEEEKKILKKVDHTLLRTTSTLPEIRALCKAALEAGTASVCIPPCYVDDAVQFLKGRLPVCTVIGFPNGYSTSATKVFEAKEAIRLGAQEIDMVVNLCDVKNGNFDRIYLELLAMREACENVILKVIIETCQLTEEEKIKMCELVSRAKADFIKTSTGFSTGGATVEDVRLLRQYSAPEVKVKAAGGIKDFADAKAMIEAGADRLGTSRLVK
ncbi:MAG: deoxyribose-phosphate aldolase [Clostridiales bacterium]|nr:deoxyribose-phosphate aldolase [Clostridiales bacterium]MBR6254473.1 deoxyribose-phosphate aldolase [Clostridiales bacterium]MCR5275892.1 deoxyribose-phosphate aldolase [Clostridiales bacterium]